MAGLALLLTGVWLGKPQLRLQLEGVRTTGEVIDVVRIENPGAQRLQDRVHWAPVVRFRTSDGRVVQFRSRVEERQPEWQIGEQVPVVYLPQEPDLADIDDPLRRWRYPAIALAGGVVALLIGFARVRAAA